MEIIMAKSAFARSFGFITLSLTLNIAACGGVYKLGETENADVTVAVADTNQEPSLPEGVECVKNSDCKDAEIGQYGACVDGECNYSSKTCEPGYELNLLGDCVQLEKTCAVIEDGNLCTIGSCDPATGIAKQTPKPCKDEYATTIDTCNPTTGDCEHTLDCGNCADEDPCTVDTCDMIAGCQHKVNDTCPDGFICGADGGCVKHCESDSECGDGNYCTLDSCDKEWGACINAPRDCKDTDETTIDVCVQSNEPNEGECQNVPTECTGGCDDNDQCTKDFCQNGTCMHLAPACGGGTSVSPITCLCVLDLNCLSDAHCDDGNTCTDDQCEFGACTHKLANCGGGEACDSVTGTCMKLDLDSCQTSCGDNNPCTKDLCQNGICLNIAPACGSGTAVNPTTCQCEAYQEAPTCVEGKKDCVNIGGPGSVSWVACVGGKWFVLSNCGNQNANLCYPETGCQAFTPIPASNPAPNPTPNPAPNPANCYPFSITLPAGTPATMIFFWAATGATPIQTVNLTSAQQATGITIYSPTGACSGTLEWSGRWASWQNGTFPTGAPTGTAFLDGFNKTVGFCQLKLGEGAWGITHDGVCK